MNKSCAICGTVNDLSIHHIDRNHKNNEKHNLMVLCQVCHGREHGSDGFNELEDHRHHFSDACEEISDRNLNNRLSYGFSLLRGS